ncbi:MAG TPA: DUF4214 domain-containing protein [Pyrinomonadaceae bacterium]|nr:DUF4214 domain-containing protein [Pyrinomonadaceae bacterium]
MRSAVYRRNVRATVMVTSIALMLLSLNASAFMQSNLDPAAKKPHRIQIDLKPVSNAPRVPNAPTAQLIVDGGFETGGIPNTFWNPETSTNFGTPLCDVPSCGTGGGASPPRTGAFWTWFGGIPAPETATLGQTVTFPAGDLVKNLSFFMRIGTVSSPFTDVLNVRVDGVLVASYPEPTVAEGAYTGRVINLNAFADGVSHSILFEYIGATSGTSSYVIDDVELNTRTPTAADGAVSGQITDASGAGIAGAVVYLSGTQNRKFITDANGFYRFDEVETSGFYTVRPSLANYSFSPSERSFSQLGNNTEAAFSAIPDSANVGNAIDTSEYFVRQHYLDFLGREPDESGFNFWSDQIIECGSDAGCIGFRRINVSAAYFLSIEFQRTSGLVDGIYRASFGRAPKYAEFMPDTAVVARDVVVGRGDWEGRLAANKRQFVDAFVDRAQFRAVFDGLSNTDYVDKLISQTGVSVSERDELIVSLQNGATRADVLLRIAEHEGFVQAKRNATFVMTQYFGYLRRDPDASGYEFWLNKLNQFQGNFERAEMVKAFITSGEYRDRFVR